MFVGTLFVSRENIREVKGLCTLEELGWLIGNTFARPTLVILYSKVATF